MKNNLSKIVSLFLGGLAAAVILCGSPQRAQAAVLANYTFNASTGASSVTEPGSTPGTFGSPTLTPSFNDPNFNGTDTVAIRAASSSIPDARSASDYFNFTIAPTAGNSLNLSGTAALTFEYSRDTFNFTRQFHWVVQSSVDGFTADLASGVTVAAATWAPASVDLPSGFDLQNTSVEFRILVWDDGEFNGGHSGYFDNVVLNGTVVPIPEPINVALGVFGLCVVGASVGRRFYLQARA